MSKKKTTKEYTFSEIDVELDETTKARLINLGCTEFNNLPDEVLEQLMLDYGATLSLSRALKLAKKGELIKPAPIAIHLEIDKEEDLNDDKDDGEWDDEILSYSSKEASKISDQKSIPSLELSDLAEMIISSFLEVTKEEIKEYANKYEVIEQEKCEYIIEGSANDVRWDRIEKYLKMSRQRRKAHLNRWLDEIAEQLR